MRSYVHPYADDWDQQLGDAEFAYNNAKQKSTQRSPFFVAYGFHPRTPADLYNPQAAEDTPAAQDFVKSMLKGHAAAKASLASLEQAQESQRRYYDRKKARTPFSKGSWVLLDATHYKFQGGEKHKLRQPWLGPFKVRKMVGPNAATLELPQQVRVHPTINVSRLQAYKGRMGPDGRPLELKKQRAFPSVVVEDEQAEELDMGEVENVISLRDVFHTRRRAQHLRREFEAKFVGHPEADNSWLTAEQIRDPQMRLQLIRNIARGAIEAAPNVYRSK